MLAFLMTDPVLLGMDDKSLAQIFREICLLLALFWMGSVAAPSALKYFKGVLLDSSQGTYLTRS